jgi:hypothetical protein
MAYSMTEELAMRTAQILAVGAALPIGVALFFAGDAYAWNLRGHMMVAATA